MKKIILVIVAIGVLVGAGLMYYYMRPPAPDIDPTRLEQAAATAPDQLRQQIQAVAQAIREGQYQEAYEQLQQLESDIWLVEGASEQLITKLSAEISYLRDELGKKLGVGNGGGGEESSGEEQTGGEGSAAETPAQQAEPVGTNQ